MGTPRLQSSQPAGLSFCLAWCLTYCTPGQVSYEDSLNKGGLSFETKDGTDVLRRRLLLASDGKIGINVATGREPEAVLHLEGDLLATNGSVGTLIVLEHLAVVGSAMVSNISAENVAISEHCSVRMLQESPWPCFPLDGGCFPRH